MVLNIKLTPLYGARTDDHALATLLTLDGLNILLDCGWNSQFNPTFLSNLATIAPSIHVVLISHPDQSHLGALPYAVAKLGLTAPVFSTLPVWRMGQMFMYDTYLSQDAQTPFNLFNLDDVDATFEYSAQDGKSSGFTLLKYQQHFPLDAVQNGQNVVITPHRAGHIVGGTVWNITKGTESIVYAVHFNHRKERHLNATTLVNFSRPSHLIVSATNALAKAEATVGSDELLEVIVQTVKRGGNALVPVDTAGRVIELAVLMEMAWEKNTTLRECPLVFLHALSVRTFDFARSMIEWMSDEVVRRFDISRDNLFLFKHVKLIQSLSELESFRKPCVVFASSLSMDMGFSRELFIRWCEDSRNCVVLVDRPEPNTLYAQLHAYGIKKRDKGEGDSDGDDVLELSLAIGKKIALRGEELDQWREQERSRKKIEAERKRQEEEARAEAEAEERAKAEAEALEKAKATAKSEGEGNGSQAGGGKAESEDTDGMDVSKENEEERLERLFDENVMKKLEELDVISSKKVAGFESMASDEPVEWNDYGQKVDTVRFIFGEDPGEGGMFEDVDKGKEESKLDGEEEVIPMKHVQESKSVKVCCEVFIRDCSGLSDGDSLKRLLKEVEPRHVSIITGSEDETDYLKTYLTKSMHGATGSGPERFVMRDTVDGKNSAEEVGKGLVVAPKAMEVIDISSDMSVYEVSLDDRVVETVQWDDIGLSRIGFMKGRIADAVDENSLSVVAPYGEYEDDDLDAEVDLDAKVDGDGDMDGDVHMSDVGGRECRVMSGVRQGHGTYLVGTVMLNKLKDCLVEAGVKVEFAGGALCVENGKTGAVVVVKKVAGQHIVVEGAFSEELVAVRDMLYKQVVIPR